MIDDDPFKSRHNFRTRERTTHVIVHFLDDQEASFLSIKAGHLCQGETEIGYHYIIEGDGKLLQGRNPEWVGAFYPRQDATNLGIGIAAGRDTMDHDQQIALELILAKIKQDFLAVETVKYVSLSGTD